MLKIGTTYEIRHIGPYEWNHYKGTGVFTGITKNIDGKCFEFKLPSGETAFFPKDDVFPLKKKTC